MRPMELPIKAPCPCEPLHPLRSAATVPGSLHTLLLPFALPEAVHWRGLGKLAQLCEGEEGELWEGDVAAPAGQVLSQQLHHLRGRGGGQGAGAEGCVVLGRQRW
jgi:hypothetical protein